MKLSAAYMVIVHYIHTTSSSDVRLAKWTFYMYMLFVHVLCTCSLYVFFVHVLCTCSLYMFFVHVLCTCSLYMVFVHVVHVPCTCSLYMLFVHVLCTCSLYMFFVHVLCNIFFVILLPSACPDNCESCEPEPTFGNVYYCLAEQCFTGYGIRESDRQCYGKWEYLCMLILHNHSIVTLFPDHL